MVEYAAPDRQDHLVAHETDVLIIGAGPTGLFAAYYAGFRGLRVAVVDSLPELGGQITAMYPEKAILDVAGFPSIKGRELVEGLVEQASSADPEYFLERTARTLRHNEDSVTIGLDDGTEITAGAVLITAGIGKFSPRPLPAGDGWLGRGMEFFVPSFQPYVGKDVVIVGGGDSAFDWAQHLEQVARSVTLVHRRDAFRAHERTVQAVKESSVEIITTPLTTPKRGDFHVDVDLASDAQLLVRVFEGEETIASRVIEEVCNECIQIHGGYGYMKEYEVERAYRDARLNRIGAGTDEIMLEVLGRSYGL